MIKIKTLFIVIAAVLLSACIQQPLLAPEVANTISVQQINVDTANLSGVSGREINVSNTQVRADIQRALNARMQGRGLAGGSAVSINVGVNRVALVSPGQSLLIGGVSSISATVSITDLSTGAVVLPATAITASSEGYAPGGIIAATSRGTPEADYNQAVASFADSVATRILGTQSVAIGSQQSGVRSRTPAATGGGNALRKSAWQL